MAGLPKTPCGLPNYSLCKPSCVLFWLLQEDHELGGEEGRAEFSLLLARPRGSGGSSGAAALAQQLQQQAL